MNKRFPRKLKKQLKNKLGNDIYLELLKSDFKIKSLHSYFVIIDRLIKLNNDLCVLVTEEPEFGATLNAILQGKSVADAFRDNYSDDMFEPILPEGTPVFEDYQKYKRERKLKLQS